MIALFSNILKINRKLLRKDFFMQKQNETIYENITKEENDKKTSKPPVNNDLDDYIFCDENIKYQSER